MRLQVQSPEQERLGQGEKRQTGICEVLIYPAGMHTEGTQAEASWGVGKGRELIRERELWTKQVASKRAVEKLQGRDYLKQKKTPNVQGSD